VLIGDAAHAIVPFFGQGMNAAFEDCTCLAECLKSHATDIERALREYETLRKDNADAIADMALDNFIEMRDKVASPWFRWKKKLEHGLHAVFPETMTPLYNMVSFSTIPYAEAKRRDEQRSRVIRTAGWWIIAIAAAIVLGVAIGASRAL
jgi:kynurenine 3-monooxygenase